MALLISVGNLGGIAGVHLYIPAQAPTYHAGFGTGLRLCVSSIVWALVLRRLCRKENEKKRKLIQEEGEENTKARLSEQDLLDLGDRSPFFVYTL
jgi:hypothetical protein